ncbi:helix-turn-helix domain-containing protein [Saccharothrix algeriensis]|uniref:Helix-turn-helix transcriptional regulator n=1 Tax=Saccharothrix algeriensis TaxID=173560 RepID=A0A8T8I4J6_9PSEU|nr:helix-turn-helix transcriptional regulator [Saccharothrix algeriensis]MBM7811969.1 transcriptional regulator with XRE-family HTH domain [Saccharothrix algeriensis]QTR05667.1 helix-turn-helix transcriptional regulator [Saccharothrix algeriensis]
MTAVAINRTLLRRLRVTSRRTVTELAAEVGCTKGALSGIERGHRTPSPALLGRLADALAVDPEDLLLGECPATRG